MVSVTFGVAVGVVFVRRQRRLDDPLIDLGLFRAPTFTSSRFLYGFGILLVFGGFLFIPQYLQLVLGLSPLQAGLWTLPWALAFVVGSQVTPKLAQRFAPTTIMAAGLALAALGFVVFTQVDATSGFAMIVTGSVAFSLGTAPVFTLTNDLMIWSAPPNGPAPPRDLGDDGRARRGARHRVLRQHRRRDLRERCGRGHPGRDPAGERGRRSGHARRRGRGRGQLPAELGAPLLGAANDAFISGMHVVAVISVVGTLALAAFTATVLRRRSDAGAGATEEQELASAGLGDADPAVEAASIEP